MPSPPHSDLPFSRLPSDESLRLQNRRRISRHFESSNTSPSAPPNLVSASSSPRDRRPPHDRRLLSSEIRYATRQALGRNFDFTSESLDPFIRDDSRRPAVGLHRTNAVHHHARRGRTEDVRALRARARSTAGITSSSSSSSSPSRSTTPPHRSNLLLRIPRDHRDSEGYAGHCEVVGMMEQIEVYQERVRSGRCRDMVRYREDCAGRPVRVLGQVMSPVGVRSCFEWDSSDGDDE